MADPRTLTGYPQPTVDPKLGRITTDRPAILRLKAQGFTGTASGGESTVKKLKANK